VNLRPHDFRTGINLSSIYRVREGLDIWAARPGFYDQETGLHVEPEPQQLLV
jgi:hypothetical protein